MKILRVLTLTALLASFMVGCAVKEEVTVSEETVIDYTNTTVFELLELSDKIEFIGKGEGADILAAADDIFTRLSRNDELLVFGNNNERTDDNELKFFFNSLLEWDTEFLAVGDDSSDDRSEYEKKEEEKLNQLIGGNIAEKDRIISIVLEIEDYFTDNNLNMPSDIKVAKYSDLFEYEEAFSVDNTIFLSEKLLTSHKETIKEEMIRQLFYVYLNTNPDKEEALMSRLGFTKAMEFVVDEKIVESKYTNPNNPKLNYIYKGQYAGTNISFIAISYIKKATTEDLKDEVITKYYSVENSQEVTKFSMYDKSNKKDENGAPIILDLVDMTNFDKYYIDKSSDFKTPRMIASNYFIDMIEGKTKREPKIIKYFEDLLKK